MGEVRYGLPVTGFRPHTDHLWAMECRYRNVRRLLETDQAQLALAQGNKEQLAKLYDAIQAISPECVKRSFKEILKGDALDSKSYLELRNIARQLHIINYSRFTKCQLIRKIEKARSKIAFDLQSDRSNGEYED